MGDLADWTNDCMQEANPGWFPLGRQTRRSKVYGPPLVCKHCGSRAVYWQNCGGVYKLFDTANLQRHDCSTTKDMNANGFDEVTS